MMPDWQDILVVGSPGRLARAFVWRWPAARRAGRADFDITNRLATMAAIGELKPKLVVNCAALTDMARCDQEPDLAWAVNVRGVRNLAEACREVGATLVHFSSDYALSPPNEYGWTKRASESLAHLTIRAKIYDGSHWAWAALLAGRVIKMLTTEFLNPISITGVAAITEELIAQGQRGVVAVGTRERLSFWQVGRIWAEVLGADAELVQPLSRLEGASARLAEMFLDPSPLAAAGIAVPELWDDASLHQRVYFSNLGKEGSA
jgi:dTDP-4-dehydrorhamnose reductase